ncbi:hypothetical protein NQ318_020553, partial [Aromia moschata]
RSIKRFLNLYRQTASVNRRQESGRPIVRTEENVKVVRQVITESPKTSISHLPHSPCRRILKNDLELHPYRLQATHEILLAYEPLGLQFYQWFINYFNNNDAVFKKAWFHLSSYVNSHHMRLWNTDNPHIYIETPLHPQTILMWVASLRVGSVETGQ